MGGVAMTEAAPANAGEGHEESDEARADRLLMATLPEVIGVERAAAILGLGVSTIRRRVDAWCEGDRRDYALMGDNGGGARTVNTADLFALKAQRRGEVAPGRHRSKAA